MIRVKKIKLTDKQTKVRCEYEKRNSNLGWDEFTIHTTEDPEPELLECLRDLREDLIEICELEDEMSNVSVTGVSFSHQESGYGATLIGFKGLSKSNAPLNLVAPHKRTGEDVDEKQQLSGKCADRLSRLINFALRFIDGKRAQGNIFEHIDQSTI